MSGNVKILFPTSGDVLILGRGPYSISWEFSGFDKPWNVSLEIFLGEKCQLASKVALTNTTYFWIPEKNVCASTVPGRYRILLKWDNGEAKGGEFKIIPPPVELFIYLEPDKKIYDAGKEIRLSWKGKKGTGVLSLWSGDREFCVLERDLNISRGFYRWRITRQCGGKSLLGRFVQFRIYYEGREIAESHVFKIVGEMPRPGRIW